MEPEFVWIDHDIGTLFTRPQASAPTHARCKIFLLAQALQLLDEFRHIPLVVARYTPIVPRMLTDEDMHVVRRNLDLHSEIRPPC